MRRRREDEEEEEEEERERERETREGRGGRERGRPIDKLLVVDAGFVECLALFFQSATLHAVFHSHAFV